MNKLEYKGYIGSIEYSEEDDCLFGQVLGMSKDLISYEGNTASELYEDFKGAVNDYLDLCKQRGIKPRKSYSGVLNIRIPPNIHQRLAIMAEENDTTINAVIRTSIERQLILNS